MAEIVGMKECSLEAELRAFLSCSSANCIERLMLLGGVLVFSADFGSSETSEEVSVEAALGVLYDIGEIATL